ncbi:MAG: thermonuclease family protein [Hyphomicrobiaceae bacterium]|nr:thermonuclease family protein [Hyphomicrobiaceae bacterium]
MKTNGFIGTLRRLRSLSAAACCFTLVFALSPLAPVASTTSSDIVAGRARVVDGDTIEIDRERIRIHGIDAPESAQTCSHAAGGTWRCGDASMRALVQLTTGKTVTCERRGRDLYGRTIAVCRADGADVGGELVRQGLAWAFVRYSRDYVALERAARAARVGLWQAQATPAWEFRATRWAGAQQKAPEGCPIKGNISARGRIYHMPWSPWYHKIKMDTAGGKRWFCSESEAQAAGWRPAAMR